MPQKAENPISVQFQFQIHYLTINLDNLYAVLTLRNFAITIQEEPGLSMRAPVV